MPSMLMAIVQSLVSSLFAYSGASLLLIAYALLRYRSVEMAWFTAIAFLITALYITQVRGVWGGPLCFGAIVGGSSNAASLL